MSEDRPDGELLTLDQAAAELGWQGKYRWERMRRMLEGKEAELQRPIMTRVGKRGDRKVSRGALRRYCLELFESSVTEIGRGIRRQLELQHEETRRALEEQDLRLQRRLQEADAKIDKRIQEHPVIVDLVTGQRDLELAQVEFVKSQRETDKRIVEQATNLNELAERVARLA